MTAADKPARTVTKISSCQVYAVSRWGTEQPGNSFGLILLLFLTKIEGGNAHRVSSQGKSPAPEPQWQPCCVAGVKRERGWGIWARESARGTWRGGYFPLFAHQKLPLSIPLLKPTMQVSKADTQDRRGNRKVRRPLYSHTFTCIYHFSTQTNSFRYLTAIFLSCKTQLKQYDS